MAKQSRGKRETAVAMLWQEGRMVMQDRTHEKRGEVGFFGGKLEPGEKPEDGVVREIGEETTLVLEPTRLKLVGELSVDSRKVHVFTCLLPHEVEIVALEGEVIIMHAHEVKTAGNLTAVAQAIREEYIDVAEHN